MYKGNDFIQRHKCEGNSFMSTLPILLSIRVFDGIRWKLNHSVRLMVYTQNKIGAVLAPEVEPFPNVEIHQSLGPQISNSTPGRAIFWLR